MHITERYETATNMKKDLIQKFLFEEKDIRGAFVSLQKSYTDNNQPHNYPAFIDKLLAEFLCASALLSSSLKFEGRLVLQIRSEGDVSLLMAESDHQQNIRAIAKFKEDVTFTDFQKAFAKGTFAMTIEPLGKEPYQGIVPLSGDSLADCLAEYFERSEQLGTELVFALGKDCASGFLIQQLPSQLVVDKAERKRQWQEVSVFIKTLSDDDLTSLDAETLLHRLFHEESVRLFDSSPVQYQCTCSKERMDKALISLGNKELELMMSEQKFIDMSCDFCAKAFRYDRADILGLMESDEQLKH